MTTGVLYIVPTPIGNREDMTFRAVRVLGEVDRILAEDTRHTGQLLQHYGIITPLTSFTEHNAAQRTPWAVALMQAGSRLALVSDAGTPGLSDPGAPLTEATVRAGLRVEALPGAAAAITALAGSALPMTRFVFEGFPPRKEGELRRYLQALRQETRTLVFYESPRRLARMLTVAAEELGRGRQAVVARELTKLYETYHRGPLAALAQEFAANPPKGEVVVVIRGGDPSVVTGEGVAEMLQEALRQGQGAARAAAQVATLTGQPRRVVYQMALALLGGR